MSLEVGAVERHYFDIRPQLGKAEENPGKHVYA